LRCVFDFWRLLDFTWLSRDRIRRRDEASQIVVYASFLAFFAFPALLHLFLLLKLPLTVQYTTQNKTQRNTTQHPMLSSSRLEDPDVRRLEDGMGWDGDGLAGCWGRDGECSDRQTDRQTQELGNGRRRESHHHRPFGAACQYIDARLSQHSSWGCRALLARSHRPISRAYCGTTSLRVRALDPGARAMAHSPWDGRRFSFWPPLLRQTLACIIMI
jgi:hypothetical protein